MWDLTVQDAQSRNANYSTRCDIIEGLAYLHEVRVAHFDITADYLDSQYLGRSNDRLST